MITLEEMVEILATLEAASPAPWKWEEESDDGKKWWPRFTCSRGRVSFDDPGSADGKLIINAPVWLAKLYLEIERLKKVNARRAVLIHSLVEAGREIGKRLDARVLAPGALGNLHKDREAFTEIAERAIQEIR